MAELIPTWPFVVMSEENVILKKKERFPVNMQF